MVEEIQEQPVDVQKQYILEKIDELIEGVGTGYGEALLEELISRMERTVAHFHEEVTELLSSLRTRSEEREKKLKELWESEETKESIEEPEVETSAEKEISEWEKKLEEKAVKAESKLSKEEAPQKRGIFGKKK